MNKRKIINDPVYGFITIPGELVFDLIEHPWFQRLARIRQLGLTYLVYPGAQHSRLQHALGAMHLMTESLEVLRSKGIQVTDEEAQSVTIAILLHDIGHGPFSHTLEKILVEGISHEELTLKIMESLNVEFGGALAMALEIFKGKYHKKFLHQLVSGQLDMDRLDYLNRDSFFTGVAEGVIGYDRIIKMLSVHDNQLVVESKGVYSIEKFLISRRLMYWQVYLHKTVLAAEAMLIKLMERARKVFREGTLDATPALSYFLEEKNLPVLMKDGAELLNRFTDLDDTDVISSMKMWRRCSDPVLARFCKNLLSRKLLKIELRNDPFTEQEVNDLRDKLCRSQGFSRDEAQAFVFTETTMNHAYHPQSGPINIIYRDGSIADIARSSVLFNLSVLDEPVVRYYMCHPKLSGGANTSEW